eukprot:scaffold9226_cov133-Chaetoceros_neogracile.AAC.2
MVLAIYRLSAIGYRLSAIGYRLSTIDYRLSTIDYRLSKAETETTREDINIQNVTGILRLKKRSHNRAEQTEDRPHTARADHQKEAQNRQLTIDTLTINTIDR